MTARTTGWTAGKESMSVSPALPLVRFSCGLLRLEWGMFSVSFSCCSFLSSTAIKSNIAQTCLNCLVHYPTLASTPFCIFRLRSRRPIKLALGSAASSVLHASHHISSVRVRMLQRTGTKIAKDFIFTQKSNLDKCW